MDPDSCLSIIEEWCSGFTFASPSVGALAAAVLAVLLLCVSGLVSASEIAFFSLSENDREEVDEEKSAADKRIRKLLDDSERLLATILISNHFVNVTIVVLGALLCHRLDIPAVIVRRDYASHLFGTRFVGVLPESSASHCLPA